MNGILEQTEAPATDFGGGEDAILAELTKAISAENEPAAEEQEAAQPVDETQPDNDDQAKADAEEKETEEPVKVEAKYTVKVDGKDEHVTLEDLISGFQRQADYTRKTQAVAEQRKQIEQEASLAKAERQQYQQGLQLVLANLKQFEPPKPDDSLRFSNPGEWSAQVAQYNNHFAKQQQLQTELQRVQSIEAAQAEKVRADLMEQCLAKLPEVIPEWKDKTVWEKESAAIQEFGLNAGFSAEELAATSDPRAIALLRMAWQYDQLRQKSKAVQPKVAKTAAPGAAKASADPKVGARERAEAKLKSNGGNFNALSTAEMMALMS